MGGQPVATGGGTEFVQGDRDDLGAAQLVVVGGQLDDDGVLTADRVVRVPPVELSGFGVVDELDRNAGTLEVLGVEVRVGPRTQLEDERDGAVRAFGLDDLEIGQFVEVRGAPSPDGTADARRVARQDRASRSEALDVEGALDTIDAGGAEVSGIQFAFDDLTTVYVVDGVEVSRAAFRDAVASGDRVRVRAIVLGSGVGPLTVERIASIASS